MKKNYGLFFVAFVGLISLIVVYSRQANDIVGATQDKKALVQTNQEGEKAQAVLEENLSCANKKDVAGYVQTLVPRARKNTAIEMEKFFAAFDVENSLQSFKVLKLENNHMLVETKIKSLNQSENSEEYRSHIATANQTFVYQDGQWLIEQTVMIDTKFI